MTRSNEPVLKLTDLNVHFRRDGGLLDSKHEIVRAVDGVSLTIPENEVVVLVGESGCGKTTLGKAMLGLERPTAGTVAFRGQDIWEARRGEGEIPFTEIRRSLQIIHQDPGSSLNPNRRVREILTAPLKRWFSSLSDAERRSRIHRALERVGMTPSEDYAKRYPHQLSGGEQQRVALVRALLMNPDVILADEAISALDVSLRVGMMDLMLELQDIVGTSFVAISHDLANARYFAGNADGLIGVMYLGRLVELGPAEAIVSDPKHPYTRALKWATPGLDVAKDSGAMPIRDIDVPDPVDPPSGCRFHSRCPYATEVCTTESPAVDINETHDVACFRSNPNHDYWESPPLDGCEK